jgi:uncharacterized protein (DUF362 family)
MSDKAKKPRPDSSVSRREFVVGGAALVGGVAAAGCMPDVKGDYDKSFCAYTEPTVTPGDPAYAGLVVEEHRLNIISGGTKLDPDPTRRTLVNVLTALTGQTTMDKVWEVVLPDYKPTEVVGIKVNVLNAQVPTHPELVQELVGLLKAGGIDSDKIVVWDRRLDELKTAGFDAATLGCRLEGTLESPGKKGTGRGYEFESVCVAGKTARLSSIQTRGIDHLINVAVMKNHFITGYTGTLKNHYGTIDNPGEFHGSIHKRAVPAINALDEVASKARLFILDATVGVCYGDTDAPPDCIPKKVAVSLDPVALDARGRQMRDSEATNTKDHETKSDAWLSNAVKLGLGQSKVNLKKVS